MARRTRGEGTYKTRKDGRIEYKFTAIDPITGSPKRVSVYGRNRAETRRKAKVVQDRLKEGLTTRGSHATVGQWASQWLTRGLMARDNADSTKLKLASSTKAHIVDGTISRIELGHLRPSEIDLWLAQMREPSETRPRGYADSTIRGVFTALDLLLSDAVRDGILSANPAEKVRRPRVRAQEAKVLTKDQLQRLLVEARGTRFELIFNLIANTGLRRGEALGLRWEAVDLDAGEVKVETTLQATRNGLQVREGAKSAKSRRRVRIAPEIVAWLKHHKAEQAAQRMAAHQWEDTGLVFTRPGGRYVSPDAFSRDFRKARDAAGLPDGVHPHTLRHTVATLLLDAGVKIRAVADILGHASVRITGDIYDHSTAFSDETAARVLRDAIVIQFPGTGSTVDGVHHVGPEAG